MRRLATLALGVVLSLSAMAHADTVFLKDGRILTGRVVDKGDTIFIEHRKFGGITVNRQDVIRIKLDERAPKGKPAFDEVVLKDGRIVRGDVRISPDGTEVVVAMGERGEVRHPRSEVDTITWRDGRSEQSDPATEDPEAAKLQVRIVKLVDDLAKVDDAGEPDLATRGTAHKELLALGLFARGYLESLDGKRRESAQSVLDSLDRLEGIRRVLPGAVEKKHPRMGERLIDPDEGEREAAVRACVMEAPHRIGALLLHLVKADKSSRLRAFCVSQLAALRKFEELAEVLRLPDGPLRLAAAFALGDAGIYAGIPILIEALRLSDDDIRSAAIHKLREYTRQHFGYRPNAPKDDREPAIAKWNAWWKENGRDLVRQGVKEVAPSLEGARLTDEEREEARRLWEQASNIVATEQEQARERVDTKAELTPAIEEDRRLTLERALDLLRRALELDPSLSTARMTRAVLLYEEFQRMDEASRELYRILDRADHDEGDPKEARKFAHYHLGMIAVRDRAWRRATLAFSQSLQYDEDYPDALSGQADAYLGLALGDDQGQRIEPGKRLEALGSARMAFERLLAALDSRSEELLKMVEDLDGKGTKTIEEGQVIQAVRRSRRSLDLQKARAHYQLGRLESASQRNAQALEHYKSASRLAPDDPDYAEAVRFWERVVQGDDPRSGPVETPAER